MTELIVIGGGLAGCEAAWQAAERGVHVLLYEMRPKINTGAHTTELLAELVCSNSLGTTHLNRAPGLLKEELTRLGSLLVRCAEESAVPAGDALAVDRSKFASLVTDAISSHPRIELVREEMQYIPEGPTVIASGPLTSPALSQAILQFTGQDHLYFYDAIAPIISEESVNFDIAYKGSRYGRGNLEDGDYINCPLTYEEYDCFIDALLSAERIELREFELDVETGVKAGNDLFFEGCLPVEIQAGRGKQALAFGPLRPTGLFDTRSHRRPHAVVQLRQDNLAGSLYNIVGFQTNLKFEEQKRVFRMIPGLEKAEFIRYGQMHRNTFIYSPGLLQPSLEARSRKGLFFAGQITGIEGYVGNIGSGLLAGINAWRSINQDAPVELPPTTMLGALCRYITQADAKDFQPMKANFGIMPALETTTHGKRARGELYSKRALADLESIRDGIAKCV